MDSESMPKELDVFLSLLGEIDMIKNQIIMLDKNTHITLSQNDVSAMLGNAECFRILKLIETLNANICGLNASFLNAAELVAGQYKLQGSPKESNKEESTSAEEDEDSSTEEKKENKNDNETINNMLQYFKERFKEDGRE